MTHAAILSGGDRFFFLFLFLLLLSSAINTYSFMSVSGTVQQELEAFVDVPQKITALSFTALFNQKFECTLYKSNSLKF